MHFQSKTFNSKISRRIFTTFVICALVPVLCLSIIAYGQVRQQLRTQTLKALRHAAKFQAKTITDQLRVLEKEFELIDPLAIPDPEKGLPSLSPGLRKRLSKSFASIAFFADPTHSYSILNALPLKTLSLDSQEIAHTVEGNTLLLERRGIASEPLVLMVRPVDRNDIARGLWIGEIRFDSLWSPDELDNLPLDTEYCVLSTSGIPLFNSKPDLDQLSEAIKTKMHSAISGHFEIRLGGDAYLASYTQVFLKPHFGLSHWDVVLFKSRSDVYAPIADFKKVFTLVVILAFIIVLWISLVYIRKSLIPIEALKAGVNRVAVNDFGHTVDIKSGDELEDLAHAFNDMSDQLRKKFSELKLIAELGRRITTIFEVETLAGTILDSIKQNLDFTSGSIVLMDPETNRLQYQKSFGFDPPQLQQIRSWLSAPNFPEAANPVAKSFASQQIVLLEAPADPEPSDDLFYFDAQTLVCIPITYENRCLGVLMLSESYSTAGIPPNDMEILTGIAAQTAVSMANISSFQKIQESEERFRKAFEHSPLGMKFIHPDGRLLKVNAILSQMLGYPEKTLLSKTYSEIIHPRDLARCLASLKRLLEGSIGVDSFEMRYRHRNGEDIWAYVSTSLLRGKSGEPLYFISLVQDLTSRKEAQKEKRLLEAQLQQAQKMEAIGTLAGGIAHDFNNILSAIIGYTELSLMTASSNETVDTYLQSILGASMRASELVKQILMFSSRHEKPEIELVNIGPVVREATKLLQATLPPTIGITQSISDDHHLAYVDPTHIHQVVMNLCTNAYHAILEKGSGSLHVELVYLEEVPEGILFPTDARPIPFAISSCLKLTISDTGCGISPDNLERIFEPYFTTKGKEKGTGMGLSVVHGIIQKHGGVIKVRSLPVEGTAFDIFLPTTKRQSEPAEEPPGEVPSGTERVLIVDDEHDITTICHTMLTRLGYTVRSKNEPWAALAEFRSRPDFYDLVITDMAMPKMMGSELAAEIRKIRPDIPIICATGYMELLDDRLTPTSFANYLPKPIVYEELARIVRQTIDRNASAGSN